MSLSTEPCPLCGTPLSQTRFAELQARVRAEEASKLDALQRQLESDYAARLKAATDAAVDVGLRDARNQIDEGNTQRTLLAERIGQLEAREAALTANHAEAIRRKSEQLETAVAAARERGRIEAEQQTAAQVAELRTKSETALKDAQSLASQLGDARRESDQRAEQAKKDVAEAERRGQASAEARVRDQIQGLRAEIAARSQEATSLQQKLLSSEQTMDARVAELVTARLEVAGREREQALNQQREVLDLGHQRKLQQLKSTHFHDTSKLQEKVADLGRQLEKKTANELGDALEVDLLQALRDEFRSDDIRRVEKGEPGADIVHSVLHKGEIAGTIVIDSKNRKIFQDKFVDKLNADKLAARADHAVLSTVKFPSEHKDLFVRNDVIVAKPTQVVSIVRLLREHLLKSHAAGLTKRDQAEKKDRLYSFITSERHRQLLDATDQAIRKLEEYDTEDERAHKNLLMKRGVARRNLEKAVHELSAEISAIVEAPGSAGVSRARA